MTKDVFLVVGGSGFLGRHIVQALVARGDNVSVLDIVQRYDDVPFYSADISQKEQVLSALRRVCILLPPNSSIHSNRRVVWNDLYNSHCIASARSQGPLSVLEGQC